MTRLYKKRLIKLAYDTPENVQSAPMEDVPTKNVPIENASDMEQLTTLLDRIDEASDNLKDIYYVLFDNLNAIYDAYPEVYEQLQMIVKLPTNEDAENIVNFNNDLKNALMHFKDRNYVQQYL